MPKIAPAGPHTAHMWDLTTDIRLRIDGMDFLSRLVDGTLEAEQFTFYLQQDALYLVAYARALLALTSHAEDAAEQEFWRVCAEESIVEEQRMQEQIFAHPMCAEHRVANPRMSLQTLAYTAYLGEQAAEDSAAVAYAAILPCFWIYAEVGADLHAKATSGQGADLSDHPYGTWIEAYADPAFQQVTARAVEIVEAMVARASDTEREAAYEAFRVATRCEELFWDQAMIAPTKREFI